MVSLLCTARQTPIWKVKTQLFSSVCPEPVKPLYRPTRNVLLIGDDEHGWDDEGVFNYEGGCYAKVINLDKDSEPDIYNAIKRDALLENVTVDANGKIDFNDKSVTENTRVSYPIYHIKNIVKPVSKGPAAQTGYLLVSRRIRSIASGIHPERRTDKILFPVRIYRKIGRNRAWNYRADTDFLCLFRSCFLITASRPNMQKSW